MKTRTFSDPTPSVRFETTTSPPTDDEAHIASTDVFDPIAPDPVENLTGFVVRCAVDIARYERSISIYPEKRAHYERLIRCATFAAQARINMTAETEGGASAVQAVRTSLDQVSWEKAPDVPLPVVRPTLPYSGTEAPFETTFVPQRQFSSRHDIPA
jgi:hypothetical protein